jgi:hypothetical protein
MTPASCRGRRARPGRNELPQGHPGRANQVGHRPGGPAARPAAGPGGRPHQGRGGRLAGRPVAGVAGRGRYGGAGPLARLCQRAGRPACPCTVVVDHYHAVRLANSWSTRSAAGCSRPPSGIEAAPTTCYTAGADSVGVAELSRLTRTVRAWEAELPAIHTTGGCSNGPTEAVNLLTGRSSASATASATSPTTAYGCYCTAASPGQTHRTARLRSRPPRFVEGPVRLDGRRHRAEP